MRIGLREFRQSDWEPIFAWAKDPKIKNNFRFTQKELSEQDIQDFVTKQIDHAAQDEKHFVIYSLNDSRQAYIGSVGLKHIDHQDSNAELTIVISDENYRGIGLGQEALYLICQYGFNTLGLHKITLTCLAHNTSAIASYDKFGFVHEGVRKEQVQQSGVFYDEIMMGILREQFRAKRQ